MRKISGIIPPNARTQSAEISRSQPARPGAPSHGRPMGRNSQADRITLSQELEALRGGGELPMREPPTYSNTTEGRRAKLVQDLSDRFFTAKGQIETSDVPRSESTMEEITNSRSLFTVEPELRQAPQASLESVEKT